MKIIPANTFPNRATQPGLVAPFAMSRTHAPVLSALPPASDLYFGKKLLFNLSEAQQLAASVLKVQNVTQDASQEAAQLAAMSKALMDGKSVSPDNSILFGMVYPNGTVKSNDASFSKIAGHILAALPQEGIPKEGFPMAIQLRNEQGFQVLKEFLEGEVIPAFQLKGELTLDNKKNLKVFETVAWPFFQAVISGESLPPKVQPLLEKLKQLPLFKLQIGNLPEAMNEKAQQAFAPIRTRLAAIETARMQYSDRVNIKEVVGSLTKGAIVGGVGELVIHSVVPDGGLTAGAMRSGLLVAVDAVDNVYGEMGVLHSDLEANGLKMDKETVFGEKSWWKIIKNKFKMKGPGGIFAKRAASSALKGAAAGAVIAGPVGFTLSNESASALTRAAVGGPGTLGTATAIPFNIRATMPQVYYTIRHLIDEEKIAVPEAIKNNPKQLKKYARNLAEQELLSRLGFSASMKAFSLVPLSGGILALEMVGVPRELVQVVFMGVAPAMENVLRLGITLRQLKVSNPKKMNQVQQMVSEAGVKEFTPKNKSRLSRLFADRWSKWVNKVLTNVPWPVRLREIKSVQVETAAPPAVLSEIAAKEAAEKVVTDKVVEAKSTVTPK